MKKLGKKFSFITKVMLVISLLFSNLAPLKIVFAYEKSEAIVITKTTDNKLNVRYTDEVTDVNLDVIVDETYTYLDGTTLTSTNSYEDILVTDLLSETGITIESILSNVKFDGTYNAVVKLERKLVEGSELLAVNEYVEDIKFEDGIASKVYHAGEEVVLVDGVYSVKDGDVINSQLLSGELAPTWEYQYNDVVYTGEQLIELVIEDTVSTTDHLYGEHEYTSDVTIKSEHFVEDKVYNVNLSLMYGSYADNDKMLNHSVGTNGYDEILSFGGASKTGTLYIYPDLNNGTKVITAYDLIKVVSSALPAESEITFVVSNGTEELQDKYTVFAAGQTELTVTPEEFYAEYVVDENYYVTVSCDDLTIRYSVMFFADINGDSIVTADDVLELIDKVLGLKEVDLVTDDVNTDQKLNLTDAVYLFEMIMAKKLEITMGDEIGNVSAKIEVVEDDITTGDTFTVNYVVTVSEYSMNGIAGLFSYDKDALELVSVNSNNTWNGNNNGGKFLYLGEDYLELQEPVVKDETVDGSIDETTENLEGSNSENSEPEIVYPEVDYVVLTAKFSVKKAGEHKIDIKDTTFISGVNTLKYTGDEIGTIVLVNASNDNSLKSLVVGGNTIELTEDVLDYELTVKNVVETVTVEAIVNNVAAKVTSLVVPEKLAEGANTIAITVEAENGDVKIYTVTVNREEAPEEEKTINVNYETNNDDNYEPEIEEPIVSEPVEEPEEEEPVVEEDSNKLSRIIIIILILLVIAGLIYLIFKDDSDDETKKVNKEIDKLKKDDHEITGTKSSNNTKKNNRKGNSKERR